MRTLLIVGLLALSACYPTRIQTFQLPPDHSDVLWIHHEGHEGRLWRCSKAQDGPVCDEATWRMAERSVQTRTAGK